MSMLSKIDTHNLLGGWGGVVRGPNGKDQVFKCSQVNCILTPIYRNYFKSLIITVGLSVDPLATFFAKSWRFTRMLPIVYTSKYSPE